MFYIFSFVCVSWLSLFAVSSCILVLYVYKTAAVKLKSYLIHPEVEGTYLVNSILNM